MKYEITMYHHRKVWVKGDLEAETVVNDIKVFSTKKAVVEYLKNEEIRARNYGYRTSLNTKTRGTMPSLTVHTGTTWVHENTGNEEKEYYSYKVYNG